MYSVGRGVMGDRQDRQAGPRIMWRKKEKKKNQGLDVLKEMKEQIQTSSTVKRFPKSKDRMINNGKYQPVP